LIEDAIFIFAVSRILDGAPAKVYSNQTPADPPLIDVEILLGTNSPFVMNLNFPDRLFLFERGLPFLVSAVVILIVFFFLFGSTSLWYDEANYLVLSSTIKETGYPIWFWDPDVPQIFVNGPPGLLYVISILLKWVPSELFWLRAIYSSLFVFMSFITLFVYIKKQNLSLFLLSVTALYCAVSDYYIMELVQIRMDLPLASLSFLALLLVAHAEGQLIERAEGELEESKNQWVWLTLALLALVSALSFLTKYQAVCLTGTLMLNVLVARQDFCWLGSWLPLIAHSVGVAIGMLVLVFLVMSSPVGPDIDNLSSVLRAIFLEGGSGVSFFPELRGILVVARRVVPMVILPAAVFAIARAAGSIDWRNDRLLRLCVLMAVVVVTFNMAVHRAPGAGRYYMIQAAIPLGYILARSFSSLFQVQRSGAVLALVALLTFHAIINAEAERGTGSPERWSAGFADLIGAAGRQDTGRLVAAHIAPFLQPEEVLLLDHWRYQSRFIPYWLNRSDRYGYLFLIDPVRAENLLRREGPERVGALVFASKSSLARLASEKWAGVAALLARYFLRVPQVSGAPDWTIYLRRRT
jgi:hypothetical protein